ncbi:Bromodomain-containing protein [Venustampulla echinocandica]|uniref:Bromodomain-containing protein n=1 Tax=Venustampulla echinocandica TaxID=2656787 RepID=A0A370TFQ7_9HELO|nr:Bromodomain-containing protein [Venustampulla echinocandica]RDL33727.1 Bromodomain-containing protein [Venustampulla echinocandica]
MQPSELSTGSLLSATSNSRNPPSENMMADNGVDLTTEESQVSTTISWHEPHPIFVIILIGKDETPYGIQKDLLCAQSPYYREIFAEQGEINKVEHIVKLPDTDVEIFGCFQNFIYTGYVYDRRGGREIPDYPLLMGVWKLAMQLKMAPLRTAVLDVMAERRRLTSAIPGTTLLKQAWEETEEGSGLRKMLIGWAAEHMRSSPDVRNAFAKSLPQEILSELVIVMSDLPASPTYTPQSKKHPLPHQPNELDALDRLHQPSPKRARKSEIGTTIGRTDDDFELKSNMRKGPRKSESANISGSRKPKGRIPPQNQNPASSSNTAQPAQIDADHDLLYCRDLIGRMLSGPGFWTRLVGPFKEPVDPITHHAPNYFDVVKRPIDLKTIKAKMDRGEYKSSAEFEADIRLIFQNCYEYWTPEDQVFRDCETLERYFNEKWAQRHKWMPPNVKMEDASFAEIMSRKQELQRFTTFRALEAPTFCFAW